MDDIILCLVYNDNGDIIDEASINYNTKIRVEIRPKEGENIPHVHIIDPQNNKNGDICVRLDKSEYFIHGEHKGKFDSPNAKKAFHKAMMKPKKKGDYNGTTWGFLCQEWNRSHKDNPRLFPKEIPDYSTIDKAMIAK